MLQRSPRPKKLSMSVLRRSPIALVVVIGVAAMGTTWLLISKAATPTASVTASSGNVTGCASKIVNSSASTGSAVKFTTCNTMSPLTLDASGATIPDSDYAIPAGSVYMATTGSDTNAGSATAPVKTINRAVALVPSGGTIVIRAGTYRDWYNNGAGGFGVITKPVTIQAYPHEQVWFDGSDVMASGWTSDGAGHWYVPWSTPSFCNGKYYTYSYDNQSAANSGPCSHYDMYYSSAGTSVKTAAGDPQMAFINNVAQHEVTSLAAATAGNFYYDWANKRLYISTDPSGKTVELAARPMALQLNGAGSKLLGIGFKRYASNEYNNNTGVVVYAGAGSQTYENLDFTLNAGGGLGLYGTPVNQVVNHSVFAGNGFDGIEGNGNSTSGTADGMIVENSVLNNNNSEGYGYFCSTSCSQAGMKLAHMVGFTVKNNIVTNNTNANGVWCDEDCRAGVFVNNVASNNTTGIYYEVSSGGIIASNLLVGNSKNGIAVGSASTKVYNNTLVNNAGYGIWIYDDPRWSGFLEGTQIGPDTIHASVVNNVISYGGGKALVAQRSCLVTPPSTGPDTPGYFDAYDYNSYYRSGGPGQALIAWYDTASNNTGTCPAYGLPSEGYSTLAALSAAKGWEKHGNDITSGGDPFFTSLSGGNYTIRSDSVAYHSGTVIPADVMSALGLPSGTGYSRGAISWPGN